MKASDIAIHHLKDKVGLAEADRIIAAVLAEATDSHPRRGDVFEQWLKARRDEYEQTTGREWRALDEVLDVYRLHADTGTPLDEHVCEGRMVGDCDCFEQPSCAPAS